MTSVYETLRLDVLDGASGEGRGWVLFVRRGMRTWCQMCHQHEQHTREYKKISSSVPTVTASLERTLVQVLAGMVLNLQQGVSGHV